MAAILEVWRHIKIRLRQSMRIFLKNNPDKFHSDNDSIWNNGALRRTLFEERHSNKMSSDKGQFLIQKSNVTKHCVIRLNEDYTTFSTFTVHKFEI